VEVLVVKNKVVEVVLEVTELLVMVQLLYKVRQHIYQQDVIQSQLEVEVLLEVQDHNQFQTELVYKEVLQYFQQ
jgi:hypothetical protein